MPDHHTRLVFRPDGTTRYDDVLTSDDGDWDEDAVTFDDAKGGWIWPGRGLFRVQSREVHEDYAESYADYRPYGAPDSTTVFQFGWGAGGYQHLLDASGDPIADWAGNEELDYAGRGVDASLSDPGLSLFLLAVPVPG